MRRRGLLHILLFALLLVSMLPTLVFAEGVVNDTRINYAHNDVGFRVYYIANSDGFLTSEFSGYSIDLSSGSFRDTALLLETYIYRDDTSPVATGYTTNNTLTFSDLDSGYYLVSGDSFSTDGKKYTPVPVLFRLSDDTTINIKSDITNTGSGGGGGVTNSEDSLTVHKVWRNDTSSARPKYVAVQLLRNGLVQETVELKESNGWSYTWRNLDTGIDWRVVEARIPSGYVMSSTRDGDVYTIINRKTTDEQFIPDTPDSNSDPDDPRDVPNTGTDGTPSGDTPSEGTPSDGTPSDGTPSEGTPSEGTPSGDTSSGGTPSGGKIPQTGQNWWLAVAFGIIGIGFIVFGLCRERFRG